MDRPTLRQDVWNAAHLALAAEGIDNALELANEIADRFTAQRAETTNVFSVTEKTRKGIREDLISGGLSYAKIREKHGVGMSTVQRVANELRVQGLIGDRSNKRVAAPTSRGKSKSRGGVGCKPSQSLEASPS